MKIQFYFPGNIKRFGTDCCALGQLSIQDSTTKKEIENALEEIRKESQENWWGEDKDGGDRAIFVITTPTEKNLAKNLEEIGFQVVAEFPRRNGYPEGILTMWIINL